MSKLFVGSSMISTCGRAKLTAASATRERCPPESAWPVRICSSALTPACERWLRSFCSCAYLPGARTCSKKSKLAEMNAAARSSLDDPPRTPPTRSPPESP